MKGLHRINKKVSFFGIIAVLIVTILTLCARSSYKKTNNADTNLGEASYNIIQRQAFLNKAVETVVSDHSSGTHEDCVGYVEQVLGNCNVSISGGGSTAAWYNEEVTVGGQRIHPVASYVEKGGATWIDALYGQNLQPGDIIVGVRTSSKDGRTNDYKNGHMFIYLGNFAASTTGNYVSYGSDYGQQKLMQAYSALGTSHIYNQNQRGDTGVTTNYWYAEGNINSGKSPSTDGSGRELPMVRNYNWGAQEVSGSTNMYYLKVYRITYNTTPGEYTLRVGKLGSENLSKFIGGAEFTIERRYNGSNDKTNPDIKKTTVNNDYTLVETRVINSTNWDDYRVTETKGPDGYDLYNKQLGLQIRKELTANGQYRVKEVYYYSGAQNIAGAKNKSILPGHTCYIFPDGTPKILGEDLPRDDNEQKSKAMAYIAVSDYNANNKVEIKYVGIDKKQGQYHLNVTKKEQSENMNFSDKSQNISGITFNLNRYADKSESEITAASLGNATQNARKDTSKRTSGNETIIDAGAIFENTTISNSNNGKWDVYTVSETITGNNAKYYKDINNILANLRIGVYKDNYKVSYIRIFTKNSSGTWAAGPNSISQHHTAGDRKVSSYDISPNEIGIFDFNGDGKADFSVEINDQGSAIELTVVNPIYEGKYSMQIRKVEPDASIDDFDLLDGFDGVKFKVNGNYLQPTTSRGAFKGYANVVTDEQITKANVGTLDEYYIEEIDLGDNRGIVKLAEPVGIYVGKGLNPEKTAYTSTAARFMKAPGKIATNNGQYVTQQFELEDGTKENVGIKVVNGMVTVAIPNNREGKYNLNIGKKSTETYCPNFPEEGHENEVKDSDYISGARFEVVQYLNTDITTISNPRYTGGSYPASKDGEATPVTFSNEADIAINNVNQPDCYVIKEIDCPAGYQKNEQEYCIKVIKEKDTTSRTYKIKTIKIYQKNESTNRWDECTIRGTLYSDPNGEHNSVLWGARSAVYNEAFRVELNKNTNTITFVMADQPIDGKYNFLLEKTNSRGVTIKEGTATFKVYPYNTIGGARTDVHLSGKATLYDSNNNAISSETLQNLTTVNGICDTLSNLKIQDADIGQTYYFLIHEEQAPGAYTKIGYDVVVPVKFERSAYAYKATVDEANAFAIFGANPNENGASGTRMNLDNAKGSTVGVKVSQSGASIQTRIPNTQSGSYNFEITKTDVSGQIIKDEKTRFDVSIFVNENLTGDEIQISNASGIINTKNLVATTGVVEKLDGIIITNEDINKTYYFVVTETEAPDEFTKIDYEVVVPISYTEVNGQYKATKGEPFAVRRNDRGEVVDRMSLAEAGSATTGVVSTEQVDATINVNVPDVHKAGTYDFRIVKVDVSGNVIEDEEAEFNISVYDNEDCIGREVTLSKLVQNSQGQMVEEEMQPSELKGLKTVTGIVEEVAKNIVIHSEDVTSNKTYYFRIHETKAPDEYTEIDYDVVVPISFTESGSDYVAVKGEAYAITTEGDIKTLAEVGSETTGVVSTAQVDAAIIVNVPNKHITGKYAVNLLKVNSSDNSPIANAIFNIASNPVKGIGRDGVRTGSDGMLDISNGEVTIVGNNVQAGSKETNVGVVDTYTITEASIQSYMKLKWPISISVEKAEKDGEYVVSRLTLKELFRANSASVEITDTNRSVTLNNVLLADSVSTVSITASIDSNNSITVTVPNKELEGKFKLSLVKVEGGTKNKLSGIPFSINNVSKETNGNGLINVTEDDEESDGYVKITKENVSSASTYTIQEQDNENTKDFAIIEYPITINVNKGPNSGNTAYVVTSVDVTYTSNAGEQTKNITRSDTFYVKTKDTNTETKCTLTLNSTGEITLEAENISKNGTYTLGITKNILDSEGNSTALPGVTFEVKDLVANVTHSLVTQEEGAQSVAGNTERITKSITKNNVNTNDVFVIDEVSSTQENVVKLKNNIKIEVTKGLNNDESNYAITGIKLWEVSKSSSSQVIQGPEEINPVIEGQGNVLTLHDVELENGENVDLTVIVGSNTSITMNVTNTRPKGQYQLKIRKVNSVTGQAIGGISFNSSGAHSVSDSTTTGTDGIGNFRARNITSTQYEQYSIRESELPDALKGKVVPLTDFSFEVCVYPKLDKDTMSYVVNKDDVHMTVSQYATSETTEQQRKIANEATIDVNDNIITLTIKNEPTVDYALKIRKINTDDEALKNAKFTVYEDGEVIIENKSINDLISEGVIQSSQDYYLINRTGMNVGKTHTYKIYEESPAIGYDNILEKAYIIATVTIADDGTVTAGNPACRPRYDKGGTSLDAIAAYRKITNYLEALNKELLEDEGDNTFMLTIPNPRTEIPMELKLLKHTTASENNGVTGAVFTTKKLVVANEQTPTDAEVIIARLNVAGDNLDPITTDAHNLISDVDAVDKAIVGNSYYYMLTESEMPDGFQGFYQKAVVRIHANTDRTVSASLIAAMPFGSTTWITDPSTITADFLSVNNPEGNTVQVKWANRFDVNVELWKKAYTGSVPKDANGNTNWQGMQSISGAHFTVKQVEGNTETYVHNVSNQEMNDLECDMIEVMRDINATTEKTYHYTFEENSSRANYINIFDGVKVHLYVTTTADGKINRASNKTYYTLEGATTEKARFLSDKIGLVIEDHKVEIYIANEEKTLNVNIKKVSTNTASGTAVPVSDVTFGVLKDRSTSSSVTTDENGDANLDANVSRGGTHLYQITEISAPDGVNKLEQVEIDLNLDLSDLDSIDDITLDRASLSISATGATGQRIIEELDLTNTIKLSLQDSTFVITVPNVTKVYTFSMFKTDEGGVPITNSDGNGLTSFQVQRVIRKTATGEFVSRTVLNNGELLDGLLLDYGTALPNHTYEYEIKEIRPKDGYINVLQGYELHVIAKTDANGLIYSGGNPEYTLVETGTEPTLYTENELRTGDYINLSADSNNISLYIMNPYDYKFKLSKYDKDGNYPVNQAVINAEKISGAHIQELYVASNNSQTETVKTLLKEIVDSDSVENTVNLRNASTVTSGVMEIRKNDGSMMPQNGIAQLWRITEDSVAAPYENVLEGKYVIVPTMYSGGQLNTVEHPIGIDDSVVNVDFYVCDAEGNDLTADYINVIDVDAVKNAGDTEWTLSVAIKDPMKIRLKFNKVELASESASQDSDFRALSGATLEIADNTSGRSYSIANGASSTEVIDLEVGMGNTEIFAIRETASAPGHTNIFENKQIMLAVRTLPNNPTSISFGMIDMTSDRTITGAELNNLLRYINAVQSEDENGYPVVNVYIENPIEYDFKLEKFDGAENLLEGTDIVVNSSKSGTHSIGGGSNVSFTEHNLKAGDIVSYTIREYDTVPNSAYINKFKDKTILIVARVQENGSLTTVQSVVISGGPNGTVVQTPIWEVDGISYEIRTSQQDGKQTLYVKMENPINIDINVQKRQYGQGATTIPRTKFTLTNEKGEVRQNQYTDANGNISFNNVEILPGTYTYKVEETATAGARYVNILENKYYLVNFTVDNDGEITINSAKIFNSNDTEISPAEYVRIGKYVDANVDTTNPIRKLNIVIYNPIKINFDLFKKDIESGALKDVQMEVRRFTVGNTASDFVVNELTDDNGYVEVEDGYIDPGLYRYVIKEIATSSDQYINVIEDLKVVVYVRVFPDGTIKLADKDGNAFEGTGINHYYIYDSNNSEVTDFDKLAEIYKYLSVNVNEENYHVVATLKNPIKYELDIIKKNKDNEDIGNNSTGYTKFSVRRDAGVLILDNVDITTAVERIEQELTPGTHTYYITEDSTLPGYINILKDKFIRVTINVTGKGVVTVTDYGIYAGSFEDVAHGTLIPRTADQDLYNNVEVTADDDNRDNIYTIKVKVINPDITYNVTLNKKIFGEDQLNLSNTKFTIISEFSGTHTLFTDRYGNIKAFTEERVPAGVYRYLVTESEKPGDQFVNVLKNSDGTNSYIEVMLKVNEDGTVEIVDEDGNSDANRFYLYKQRASDPRTMDPVDFDETVADEFISVDTSITNKVSELEFYIVDPERYNFELIKKDKDTDEKMNNVEFSVRVYDENGNPVGLRDAETLEYMDISSLVTHNENGIDGAITIPNILIEKAGKYTLVLHEVSTQNSAPILYKSWASDIRLEVEIGVQGGEYVVKSEPTVLAGEEYVDFVTVTDSRAQFVHSEVLNERIKGSYDLIIDKLDSVTEQALNGAEFDITVEKSTDSSVYNEDKLYSATDDVESMDVIIPGHFTVNGQLTIENIRIEQPETYILTLTETKAPTGYMLLDKPIKLKVTTGVTGENGEEKFIVESVELIEGSNHELVTYDYNRESITVHAKNEYFDLALRKSITSVAYADKDDAKITEEETENRIPEVVADDLLTGDSTTANYNHVKNHVRGYVGQEVIYTLRVYNEGEIDGYAEEITDHLPEGLEFVNDDFNAARGWRLDENDESLRTVKTTYLSENNNPNNDRFNKTNNLIKKVNTVTGEIDYKEIEIKCRIKSDVKAKTVLTNIAEISMSKAAGRTAETVDRDSRTVPGADIPDTNEGMQAYKEDELTDDRNTYVPGQEDDDDFEKIIVEEFDLALRKYIIAVNDKELLNTNAEKDIKYEREPVVNASALKDGSSTTATYTHPKEEAPVEVTPGDIVTYTLEIFNEGTVSGYANLIKDDIPEGLEFATYAKGDGSTNDIYRWKMVDENDNEVTDPAKAKYVMSDYLAKENESKDGDNLIEAFDPENMDKPASKYVRVAFKVICKPDYPKIIKNEAQISDDTDADGKAVTDRDSTTNEWLGEDDEDVEFIKVIYFDLALRKWVTKAIVTVDGKTTVTETGHHAEDDPEEVVKVDLKKSKVDSVVVKFEYQIRITNEGLIAGYADEVKDYIPEGLRFEQADNPTWVQLSDNVVVTDELKNTLLQPGESAEVTIVLTWINSKTNMGVKTNIAEISKDRNDRGLHDIDSTPNNKVSGEDDIDDAPVMLSIKTGSETTKYAVTILAVLAILGLGVGLVKDFRKE